MRCVISGTAMSFENNVDKVYGFQFHPESFLTINGKILIKKILLAQKSQGNKIPRFVGRSWCIYNNVDL